MKTLTFALTHLSVAFSLAYLITGSLVVGGLLALVEPMVNTLAYAVHERVWARIQQKRGAENTKGQQTLAPSM